MIRIYFAPTSPINIEFSKIICLPYCTSDSNAYIFAATDNYSITNNESKMEKVIRNGLVGILVSPGFGAGWATWNTKHPELVFSPKVIEMVEAGRVGEIDADWCEENLGITRVYCGGAEDLIVEWLPVGTPFYIHEYDGSESIKTGSDLIITA